MYELAVTEVAARFGWSKNKVKMGNDILMLLIAIALSRLLTHAWTGVGLGTVLITCINAPLIAFFGRVIDRLDPLQSA